MSIANKNLASAMADRLLKIRKKNLRKSFKNFSEIEHRMETVAEFNGVVFINDAKAENTNATYFALENTEKPIIWIVGANDNKTDYKDLQNLVNLKVEVIIILGTNDEIHRIFAENVKGIFQVKDLLEAVQLSKEIRIPGSTILFSPASKLVGGFNSYEESGLMFKKLVREII